jgi:glycogen debranching enzyme
MNEIIQVQDEYYILATSSLADDRTRVLKHGETFAIFDRSGDIQPLGFGKQGVFHEGTRHLSRMQLSLGTQRPLFLSSTVLDEYGLLAVDLTNPDVHVDGQVVVPRGTVHIFRSKFLWAGVGYERFRVANYGQSAIDITLVLQFDADFADIFEVRGLRRAERGKRLEDVVSADSVVLAYEGLDGVTRRTRLEWSPAPAELTASKAIISARLSPRADSTFYLITCFEAVCDPRDGSPRNDYERTFMLAHDHRTAARAEDCRVSTSNEQFNDWLNRSIADLHLLVTDTPHGAYPYAGIPWFSTVFGRDGILTALEFLWVKPSLAKGVLQHLAALQADEVEPERDAEPGKILHEMRRGEMAGTKEIPFGRYYGSVDSTPLFVMLASAYYERTADLDLIRSLWPHVERALAWIDTYGDRDGDGFIEYYRQSERGLVHQGWKDSSDSVFHADGTLAEGPIALCEVQGYAYAARLGAAHLAEALGMRERAEALARQADALRQKFDEAFWCDDLGTYALALDGVKAPCRVRTSNAGQCLFTGIASVERARRIAAGLLGDDFFTGWGIRTVAANEARYNPMSYHNGSVWPHDTALIARGFARYGLEEAAMKTLTGLFDASLFVDLHRLPELLCGFPRRIGEGPTLYPVACSPQAWSTGAVYVVLQSCLGLSIHAAQRQIRFDHARLPESLQEVRIENLLVAGACIDLDIERHANDVGINVRRREGHVEIIAVK